MRSGLFSNLTCCRFNGNDQECVDKTIEFSNELEITLILLMGFNDAAFLALTRMLLAENIL